MVEPRIIPREQHSISRRDIDADALKVLYRLRQYNHTAYLVGGSVRDLLLARRPKDFDIGTSAHPYQVKKLFRNCWIIGRRFRLAHVKFGPKVIEVATFRRQVEAGEEVVADGIPAPDPTTPEGAQLIHHDNTFGSPEEDAFRRDFTINALFYDIATFSIIDYVGGLDDLHARVVRSIGEPDVRLCEDPVRMLRAIGLSARLGFAVEPRLLDAIRRHRHEIAKSSPARMLEEYYKILRAGSSEQAFRGLADVGLLEPISTELHAGASDALWRSLAALDAYRREFAAFPDTLTNAILLGTLLVPLGISLGDARPRRSDQGQTEVGPESDTCQTRKNLPTRYGPTLGNLPLARRDVERLRQILGLQRRLRDVQAPPRAKKSLAHRHNFAEALTWLEIHGGDPDLVAHWKAVAAEAGPHHAHGHDEATQHIAADGDQPQRRRRRRRRRRRHSPPPTHH
ncbi:MAG TPA: polynucleotide adenylyltransferase PcnB [Vicinamibacterales bacterium]|nr:polynucleotide adenylyltransferase PcnB [Vicinamibacterales bacterium]